MSAGPSKPVLLGLVTGLYGVKGWIKVHSYTEPRANIVTFGRWTLCRGDGRLAVTVENGRPQGRTIVAKIKGIDDRDQARALIGSEIAVEREDLPPCEPGEYYWADLEGLDVLTEAGDELGKIDYLFSTGAHDVLVVEGARQRLIPFVKQTIVRKVDLDRGLVMVDWDPDY